MCFDIQRFNLGSEVRRTMEVCEHMSFVLLVGIATGSSLPTTERSQHCRPHDGQDEAAPTLGDW